MTDEQHKDLLNFEARVRQLMMAYQDTCGRLATVENHLKECEARLRESEQNLAQQKEAYNRLKTARMIEVSGGDVKESRARLSKLIREVDKCIALLDV